jgi:hypothetical protein
MRGGRGVLKYKTKTRKKHVLTLTLVIEKSRCFDPTSTEKVWSLAHPCTLPLSPSIGESSRIAYRHLSVDCKARICGNQLGYS